MDDLLSQAIALLMREELLCSRLDVTLVPSGLEWQPTQRRRRVVEERNPAWYRRLCNEWQSNGRCRPRRKKHGDTLIKRAHVLRALAEMGDGRCDTEYAQRLRPYVLEYRNLVIGAKEQHERRRRNHRDGCAANCLEPGAGIVGKGDSGRGGEFAPFDGASSGSNSVLSARDYDHAISSAYASTR